MRGMVLAVCLIAIGRVALAAGPSAFLAIAVKGQPAAAAAAGSAINEVLPTSRFAGAVSPDAYFRTAVGLQLQRPFRAPGLFKAAERLAASHVAVFALEDAEREDRSVVDVSLYDVFERRLLWHARYILLSRRLIPSVAAFLLARIDGAITGHPVPTPIPPGVLEDTTATAESTDSQANDEPGDDAAPARTSTESAGGRNAIFDGHTHYAAGFSLGLRKATLSSNGAPLSLCYCSNGGFGEVMPGAHANFALFFNPEVSNFGLDIDTFLEAATTNVLLATNQTVVAHNAFWRFIVAAAYRFNLPYDAELRPQIVFNYELYPLLMGAFPSLSFAAPGVGVKGSIPFLDHAAALHAGVIFSPAVIGGASANLLGNPSVGLSWLLEGGLRVKIWVLEIAALASWEFVAMNFSGSTSLLAPQNFTNVSLEDQHLDFSLNIGSSL